MKVINLTPHNVNICNDYGKVIKTYVASGKVARVRHGYEQFNEVDGIPVVGRVDERIVDLPDPQEDTYYIVSNIVLDYCKDRKDLLAPVQQVKYGYDKRVAGCKAFASNR